MSSSEPAPDVSDGGVSRRLLLGGGLLVLGAVGGGAAAFVTTDAPSRVVPDPVPAADVVAAIARERDLLATYDAALTAGANPLWTHLRGDHEAHLAALEALLPPGTSPSVSASGTGSGSTAPVGTTPGAAELLAAERAAADTARTACLAGNGTAAVLLACSAASEASHAAVLG